MLEVWDADWTCLGDDFKGIYRSPFVGANSHSIVVSSTNNKAIDNIGFELQKEIEFFSGFANTIPHNETPYRGIICARLGKGRNVEEFYENFYAGFCQHLGETEITKEKAHSICEEYRCIRDELNQLNGGITKLLDQRIAFPQVSDPEELVKRSLESRMESMLKNAGKKTSRVMGDEEMHDVFGI